MERPSDEASIQRYSLLGAVSNPRDDWHQASLRAYIALGTCEIITTDSVLTEYLTMFAAQGNHARDRAVATVERLLHTLRVLVVPQTREIFLLGMELYKARRDKEYSLTDCISMNTMREMGITEILTNDHHFTQEGFHVLVTR